MSDQQVPARIQGAEDSASPFDELVGGARDRRRERAVHDGVPRLRPGRGRRGDRPPDGATARRREQDRVPREALPPRERGRELAQPRGRRDSSRPSTTRSCRPPRPRPARAADRIQVGARRGQRAGREGRAERQGRGRRRDAQTREQRRAARGRARHRDRAGRDRRAADPDADRRARRRRRRGGQPPAVRGDPARRRGPGEPDHPQRQRSGRPSAGGGSRGDP